MLKKIPIRPILHASLILSFFQAVVTYCILSLMQNGGLSLIESSLNSFVSGLIFLLLSLFVPIFSFKENLNTSVPNEKIIGLFSILIIVWLLSNTFFLGFDYVIFLFDNSISADISNNMVNIPGTSNYLSKETMYDLRNYPLAAINWVSNLFFSFLGILISYFIVKKKL